MLEEISASCVLALQLCIVQVFWVFEDFAVARRSSLQCLIYGCVACKFVVVSGIPKSPRKLPFCFGFITNSCGMNNCLCAVEGIG